MTHMEEIVDALCQDNAVAGSLQHTNNLCEFMIINDIPRPKSKGTA